MRFREYVRIKELLSLIAQGLGVLQNERSRAGIIENLSSSLKLVKEVLEDEDVPPRETLGMIRDLERKMQEWATATELCIGLCNRAKTSFENEVKPKIKVAFLPYKAAMWDSLESIYFAAANDPMCEVKVVPVPYYVLSENGAEPCYEGGLFPSAIPITDYREYDLATERPDIIYVHNIYDQYNTVTRVYEEYFTANLKKYTELLVYVPYCLFSFRRPQPQDVSATIAFGLPSMNNVDKVVVQGRYFRDLALTIGLPEEKILALGSPKVDRLVAAFEKGLTLPERWEHKIRGKTVFLFDTHMLFFSSGNIFERQELLIKILNTPNVVDNSVLIWRPHPLLLAAIKRTSTLLAEYYVDLVERVGKNEEYADVIFDDSADFLPALVAADVYIGRSSSLLNGFLLKGKPIVLVSESPHESHIEQGVFGSLVEPGVSWIGVLRDAARKSRERDPHKVKLAREAWYNVDGTSGAKIYCATKETIMKTSIKL